jgi:hypothetical protein
MDISLALHQWENADVFQRSLADTDPQQHAAASPLVLVVRSFLR